MLFCFSSIDDESTSTRDLFAGRGLRDNDVTEAVDVEDEAFRAGDMIRDCLSVDSQVNEEVPGEDRGTG